MVTATIVGINGIGMAHAIACERAGVRVTHVIDTDPAAGRRLGGGVWSNSWGDLPPESIEHESNPTFNTHTTGEENGDILVIATPNRFHIPYLLEMGDRFDSILVEKPLACTMREIECVPDSLRKKTFVGHKWFAHPGFPKEGTLTLPFLVQQGHDYPPQEAHKQEGGVIWDLGSHAFAYTLYLLGAPARDLNILRCELSYHQAEIEVVLRTGGRGRIVVAYHRVGEGEVVINERTLHWMDPFPTQIEWVLTHKHPASFELGAEACELIMRSLACHG